MKDHRNLYSLYASCKQSRDREKPVWDSISKFVGITLNTQYLLNGDTGRKGQVLDEYVDDPTAPISVFQAGDYLVGIMWGTGENIMNLVPSRYVTELVDEANVADYYSFATDQTLYHMNHADCGYISALSPYAYDQFAFGTSGIGLFPNNDFKNGFADNALVARNYGVDNIAIDEGKSGQVDYIFAVYQWKVNRIIGEFCLEDGKMNDAMFKKMPFAIQQAYNGKDYNQIFNIVCGVYPRTDFNPRLKGKKGTKYCGAWFLDDANQNNVFLNEDFSERPISITRAIRVRGETYGRGSGTLLLSSIRSLNFILASSIEIIEKMGDPALGMFSNAIFGDSVLDTSPHGLTIFNSAFTGGQNPAFPIHDVGDPSAIVQFLIPYLEGKLTTGFKTDILLDFNSARDMTAQESLLRYNIRGKSLSGMLSQQKNERLIPDVRRAVSILWDLNELGVNPRTMKEAAEIMKSKRKNERIIPEPVLDVIANGRPWYEIKFNNELEKLTKTEAVQNLLQVLNAIGAIAVLYPMITESVNWYQLLKDINNNLDQGSKILISEEEFKKKVDEVATQQRVAMAVQAGQAGAQIEKDSSQANKNNVEAQNANGKK